MQKNYVHLNIDINPLSVPIDKFKLSYNTDINLDTEINSEFSMFLARRNILIVKAQTFNSPANFEQPVHADGGSLGDKVKLNFVIDGEGSHMRWYSIKPESVVVPSLTKLGYPNLRYDPDHVELIDSAEILSASLVQVGTPHSVITGSKPRLAISVVLIASESRKSLTMQAACERLSDCIR